MELISEGFEEPKCPLWAESRRPPQICELSNFSSTPTTIRKQKLLFGRCFGLMGLQERARPIDRSRLELRRILPGVDCCLGIRRQRRNVDGSLIGVRIDIIW